MTPSTVVPPMTDAGTRPRWSDTGPRGAAHSCAQRLAQVVIIVDGSGPLTVAIAAGLHRCGFGRVHTGPLSAHALTWGSTAQADDADCTAGVLDRIGAVVLVTNGPTPERAGLPWLRRGITHLPVAQHPGWVQVGPLVVPGASACLGCAARPRHTAHPPDDPVPHLLASAVAAVTVRAAVLGDHSLAGVSCDVVGDRPEIIHRYWPPQPDCGCRDLRADPGGDQRQ